MEPRCSRDDVEIQPTPLPDAPGDAAEVRSWPRPPRASPGTDALEKAKKDVSTAPHYDSSREVHEFKGFYLKEV